MQCCFFEGGGEGKKDRSEVRSLCGTPTGSHTHTKMSIVQLSSIDVDE